MLGSVRGRNAPPLLPHRLKARTAAFLDKNMKALFAAKAPYIGASRN